MRNRMAGRILLMIALGVTGAGCTQATVPILGAGGDILMPPGNLVGTEWSLTDVGGRGVVDYAEGTLTFPETGKIAGNGSCNRFMGTVEIQGEKIKVGPLAATRRACPPSVMAQEIFYLKTLEESERIAMAGPYLLIFATDKEHPLRFSPR